MLRLWPAYLVLFIALTISGLVWYIVLENAKKDAREQFERHIEEIIVSIQSQIRAYDQILRGARGLFYATGDVSRAEWGSFISSLRLGENYKGIEGIGYVAWLTDTQRDGFVREARARGFPEFDVRPAGRRDYVAAVIYLEPFEGRNLRAIGYDMYSEPVRRAAIDRALDGGRISISGKVMMVRKPDLNVQGGFLMFMPVYRGDVSGDAAGSRRVDIKGFVCASIRMNELVNLAADLSSRKMNVEIYDGGAARPADLLYRSGGVRDAIDVRYSLFSVTRTINVHDRKWTLMFESYPGSGDGRGGNGDLLALATGIAVSLLLFGYVMLLLRTRERALQLAARMTFALRESEQRFDLAVQGSAQGVWERRFTGSQDTYFSRHFKEMLGFGEHELGDDFSEFESRIHPLDRGLFAAAMAAHLSHRERLEVDVRLRTRNEGFRWFRVHGQAIWNDAGHATRIGGSIQDITQRRESEQALRLSEERLKLALEGAGRALFDWNIETDEIYMSEYWAHIIGLPSAPMVTNTRVLADLIHPADAPLQQRRILDAIKGLQPRYEVECRVRRKDGSWRWVHVEGKVVERDEAGRALRLNGTIGDITERKGVERAKSEFIAMVSHELRTPLTSIHGALSVVSAGLAGDFDPEARAMLGVAHQNSQRLLRLAGDILDVDRAEAGRLEFNMTRHALAPLVEQAVSEVKPYADTLQVAYVLEAGQPLHVIVDEGRFIQALTNLLANAAKFSPAGSTVNVSVMRVGDAVRVTVTDNGGGVSKDFRRQLFQKFSQSPDSQARILGGAGLGLNIVRALTEAMNGRAGYYPASGGGSAFYIEFPAA